MSANDPKRTGRQRTRSLVTKSCIFHAHTGSLVDVMIDDRRSCNLATYRDDLSISARMILIAECACTTLPRGNCSGGWPLSISQTGERKNKREELAKLKHAALAELERRGYAVHGKTPGQIREMLKRRPKKSARAN